MYQADNFKIIAFKKPINIEYLYAELTVKLSDGGISVTLSILDRWKMFIN